ncbi:MAG: hypothetical protein E6Q70_22320, partial [Pseudomonas monteilii]
MWGRFAALRGRARSHRFGAGFRKARSRWERARPLPPRSRFPEPSTKPVGAGAPAKGRKAAPNCLTV